MPVVVVESPAKAKTINKYLGDDYTVLASFGHVRDLPPKDGSVDTDADFAMKWEVAAESKKHVKAIKDALASDPNLILATDPDREGEAISWHLREALASSLKKAQVSRVTFNAITRNAVTEAMANPRDIDQPLVDAYLARRALDYLVGFNLSPVLWRKLPGAKSAGRVQSVATRIIVDRERERIAFRTAGYWDIAAQLDAAIGAWAAEHTVDEALKTLEDKTSGKAKQQMQDSMKQAAGTLDAVLRAPADEARLQGELQRRLDAGLDEFKWFIYRFTSPTMKALFSAPRDVWGVERAVVNVHWFADRLEQHLKARDRGPDIIISDERAELLETGGGLRKARPLLGDEPVFVANIDSIWTDQGDALGDLVRLWNPALMDAALLLARREGSIGFEGDGDFFLRDDMFEIAEAEAAELFLDGDAVEAELAHRRP